VKKSKAETELTRARIVAAASNEVRRRGLAEANIAEVMRAAGLTHGGFYRHFENRDQLFLEGLRHAAAASGEVLAERAATGGAAHALEGYLSPHHRDAETPRCPYAALGSELARYPDLKPEAWRGIERQIATLSEQIGGGEDAADRATLLFAIMVGALTLSRLADDPTVSDRILSVAKRQGLKLTQPQIAPDA
jgi:TetR/AcrR family transcriptional regulator, transcriptional repressor for nem operon